MLLRHGISLSILVHLKSLTNGSAGTYALVFSPKINSTKLRNQELSSQRRKMLVSAR